MDTKRSRKTGRMWKKPSKNIENFRSETMQCVPIQKLTIKLYNAMDPKLNL